MSVNVKCVRKYPIKSTKNVLMKNKIMQMQPDGTEDAPVERTFQEVGTGVITKVIEMVQSAKFKEVEVEHEGWEQVTTNSFCVQFESDENVLSMTCTVEESDSFIEGNIYTINVTAA